MARNAFGPTRGTLTASSFYIFNIGLFLFSYTSKALLFGH